VRVLLQLLQPLVQLAVPVLEVAVRPVEQGGGKQQPAEPMKQRPFPVGKEPGFTVKLFVLNRHELSVFHAAKEAAMAGKGKKTGVTKA
jgi:hypothetical protein